jgi:MFS transporter, FHS family, L-fucose permease
MAMTPTSLNDAQTAADAGDAHIDAPELRLFVMALFFIFGGITSLNDVIIPKLKELFTLNYTQAMLVQFCFFTAYAVIGIPGARLIKRIGYMRGAVAGLLLMMLGCLLFIPASQSAAYPLFLLALFVLASGVVIVQVVANPLISLLGKAKTAHSRLTFAQAFNSLGTTVFPYFGSILILGGLAKVSADQLSGLQLDAYRTAETQAIVNGYLGLAVALAVVGGVVWMFRNALKGESHEASSGLAGLDLLKRPRFGYGSLCIFLYVGADRQLSDAKPCYGAGRAIGRQADRPLLGRSDGRAVHRLTGLALYQPWHSAGLGCPCGDHSDPDFHPDHRDCIGLQLAGHRPGQCDHVPDDLHACLRKAGDARGGRFGDYQCGDIRRGRHPAAHRRDCRRNRQSGRLADLAGNLLCDHRRIRLVCAATRCLISRDRYAMRPGENGG